MTSLKFDVGIAGLISDFEGLSGTNTVHNGALPVKGGGITNYTLDLYQDKYRQQSILQTLTRPYIPKEMTDPYRYKSNIATILKKFMLKKEENPFDNDILEACRYFQYHEEENSIIQYHRVNDNEA